MSLQADDAAHSPSEAQVESEVAAGGDVDLDDGRHELVPSGKGGGGGADGSRTYDGGGSAGGGGDADDGLHTYVGELVSCVCRIHAATVPGCGEYMAETRVRWMCGRPM